MVATFPPQQKTVRDVIREEFIRCAKDPIYFMVKYCIIQHPVKGKIPFQLWDFQKRVIEEFFKHRYNLILKSRQLGISTLVAGFALWLMLFHSDKKILVIATKQRVAMNLVTKVRIMYSNLPTWMKGRCLTDNKLSMELANGSSIVAESASPEAGRSEALSLLIIDECAFVEYIETIWTAAAMTLATGGDAIVLSCVPKGTLVYTDKGIEKIDNYIRFDGQKRDYHTEAYHVLGKSTLRDGSLFHNNGKTPTKILKTSYSEFEASKNSKMWSCKNGVFGWNALENLSVGDYVCVQYGMNVWGNRNPFDGFETSFQESAKLKTRRVFTELDEAIAYFLGLYYSEGSSYLCKSRSGALCGGSVTITCGDDISWVFERLGLHCCKSDDGLHYTVSSKKLIAAMQYLGIDLSKKAHEKELPQSLLSMPAEYIKWLVRGIMDGDGFSRQDRGQVGIALSSPLLIKQLQAIFLNFGIIACMSVYSKEQTNSYSSKIQHNHDDYRLNMDDRNSKLYYEMIGFNLPRKQRNALLLTNKNFRRGGTWDTVPFSLDLLIRLASKSGLSKNALEKQLGKRLTGQLNKTRRYKSEHISRSNVLALYRISKNNLSVSERDSIERSVGDNLRWFKILGMRDSENETYDFSLPETDDFWCHSVVYNGYLGHQTPNGVGNLFHKMWLAAEEGVGFSGETGEESPDNKNDVETSFLFNPIKLPWYLHPERDEKWRKEQDAVLGKRKAAQECDCNFLSSGATVVEGELIKWYEETHCKPPLEKRYVDHNMWIWEPPKEGRTYVVTGDPARGDGTDSSAMQVLDVETLEQVGEYKGLIGTKEFGNLLVNIATEYNDALLVVENQSMGWAVCQQIVDRGYKNFFYSSTDMLTVDVQSQVQRNYDMRTIQNTDKLVAGITATPKVRLLVVSKIDEYFRGKELVVHSKRLIAELYTWIWLNGRADHMPSYHDDTIVALGYALLVRDTAMRLKNEGIELQKRALERIGRSAPVYIPRRAIIDPYELPIANGYREDLRWLLGVNNRPMTLETEEERKKREEEERIRSIGTPTPPSIG